MTLIPLQETKRKELGNTWCRWIQLGIDARRPLHSRWTRNEDYYKGIDAGSMRVLPDRDPHFFPLTRPKVDRIIGTVHGAVTAIKPWVQVIPEDDLSAEVSEKIEASLQYLAEKADFERYLWRWLYRTCINGIAIPQVVVGKKGFEYRSPHPKDFVAYPSAFTDAKRATLVGHRTPLTGREVEAKIKAGEYYKGADYSTGYRPAEDLGGANSEAGKTDPVFGVEDKDSDLVEVWEFLVWAKVGEREGWHLAHADFKKQTLLGLYDYSHEEVWYAPMRFDEDDESFWPTASVAHYLQGLQGTYNDLVNLYIGGSYVGAFPPVVISKGMLGKKVAKYGPAEIFQHPTELKVDVIPMQFNPGGIPDMITKIEETADRQVRISTIGTGQQFKSGTTATEASNLVEMQRQAEDSYTAAISLCLQELWGVMFMLLKDNFEHLKEVCGDAIPIQSAEELEKAKISFEVNGKASGNSPGVLVQKLQMLLELAGMDGAADPNTGLPQMDPMTGQPVQPVLDRKEIIRQIVQALQLPMGTSKIMPEEQDGLQQPGIEGIDPAVLSQLLMELGAGGAMDEGGDPFGPVIEAGPAQGMY